MLLSEFIDLTGFEPTAEEYAEIEERYYNFNGDKAAYCKHFIKNELSEIVKMRKSQIDDLKSQIVELKKSHRLEMEKAAAETERLKAELDRELEWKPYEDEHNVKQSDYERLASDSCTRELTDEEAKDIIANEFGFDRSKIAIVHEVIKLEINRHHWCRKVGTYSRKALFNAWDWNYIVFNIDGNTTMGYEMYDGALRMYWS